MPERERNFKMLSASTFVLIDYPNFPELSECVHERLDDIESMSVKNGGNANTARERERKRFEK